MRIALFGGSFNPPHVAHQLVALYVLETQPVDELWFVPTHEHAFDKPLVAFQERLRLCELAAAALGPRVRVSDVEARIGGQSRTLHTVRRLRTEHPTATFSVVVGADLVAELDEWLGIDELRRLVSFVIVGRFGCGQGVADGVEMPAISSTDVRAALRDGRDVSALVPRAVLDYIHSRGLYGFPRPT